MSKKSSDSAAPAWAAIADLAPSQFVTMRDKDQVEKTGYLFHGKFHNANGIEDPAFIPVEYLPA